MKKNFWSTSKNIATGQRDDYTGGCLLDYNYFNISIDLSKQQALDFDPKEYRKSIFLQIYVGMKTQQPCSLSKKEKKQF